MGLRVKKEVDLVRVNRKMYFVITNEPDLNPILGQSPNLGRVGLVLRVKNLGQVGSRWVMLISNV